MYSHHLAPVPDTQEVRRFRCISARPLAYIPIFFTRISSTPLHFTTLPFGLVSRHDACLSISHPPAQAGVGGHRDVGVES